MPADRMPLCAIVGALCEELSWDPAAEPMLGALHALRRRMAEPLRVAIGGKVSAGKSTLVNALLGRVVTLARPDETHRPTTEFRHAGASPEQANLVLADGTRHPLGFDSRGLVADIPSNLAEGTRQVEVRLAAPALEHLVLVDTPGLFGADAKSYSARGAAALGLARGTADTHAAIRDADAVIFLIGSAAAGIDRGALQQMQANAGHATYGFGAVALLGKADTIGRDDPFQAAAANAADTRRDLHGAVADVLPVSALLAETAAGGRLSLDQLSLLSALADSGQDLRRYQGQLFEIAGAAGTPAQRRDLLRLLGPYGVGYSVELLRAGLPAADLPTRLLERSGLPAVWRLIDQHFLANADVIKAAAALAELDRRSAALADHQPQAAGRIRAETDRIRHRPEFHRVREAAVLSDVSRPDGLRLPAAWRDEVIDLFLDQADSSPADLAGRAARPCDQVRQRWIWWQRKASDPAARLAVRRAAEVVAESYRRILHDSYPAATGR